MTYAEIKDIAKGMGITCLEGKDLEEYSFFSDGCSGGLSLWYERVLQTLISCHRCCVAHDFLYGWGGDRQDRMKADKLLRVCAAKSGNSKGLCRIWRIFRAWVMWAAVRVFGGSSHHWTER